MGEKAKILIVDDKKEGRESAEIILVPEGYELLFAASGSEALRLVQDERPDVMLLDIMMPEMNGYEVCQRCREDPVLKDMPIIMLTALEDRDSRLRGVDAGADDFITKPIDKGMLRARVRTILKLNRYRQLLGEKDKTSWIIDHAREGYLVVDEQDAIRYINPAARRYLHIPEEIPAAKAGNFLDVARAHYALHLESVWERWPEPLDKSEEQSRFLVRPDTRHSQAFWLKVELLARPGGQGRERLVRLSDVTVEMTEKTNRDMFSSIIFHKLRTPLNGIIASLDIVRNAVSDAQTDGEELDLSLADKMLEITATSADRLHGELEEILRYVRLHNDPEPDLLASAENRTTVAAFRDLYGAIVKEKELSANVIIEPEDQAEAVLPLGKLALELVAAELVANSIKFHPDRQPRLHVQLHLGNDYLVLRHRDDGIHLSPLQLEKAFLPYYQGDKYATGEVQGVGLGLPTVASVIWQRGGHCRIYNREDAPGIVTEIRLPLMVEPEASADEESG